MIDVENNEPKSKTRCTTCGGTGIICTHESFHHTSVQYHKCKNCEATGWQLTERQT